MVNPVGNFYPLGVVSPNAWDTFDFTTSTSLSSVPDKTAAVQAAVDAACSSGAGGIVWLPAGVIRLNGVRIGSGGVEIRGAGWEESDAQNPGHRGKRGTYVLTDDPMQSAFLVMQVATNCKIKDVAFIQTQAPDAGGWGIRAFEPSIRMLGPSSATLICEHLLFWGCVTGINLGREGAVGNVTVRDCVFSCFLTGLIASNVAGSLTVDNPACSSAPLAGLPNQQLFIQQQGSGIQVFNVAKSAVTNGTFVNQNAGLIYSNPGGGQPRIKVSDCDFEGCNTAVADLTSNAIIRLSGWSVRGGGLVGGALGPCVALQTGGSGGGTTIDIIDCQLTTFDACAILAFNNTPAIDLRMGPNCWIDNWNLIPGFIIGVPNPAPAIFGEVNGSAPPPVIRYSGAMRFTRPNGGPQSGGSTIIQVGDDGGEISFLPVPTLP